MEMKKIKPPFIPIVKSDVDVSNFDPEFTECEVESMSESSPTSSVKDYEGFSFEKSCGNEMEP